MANYENINKERKDDENEKSSEKEKTGGGRTESKDHQNKQPSKVNGKIAGGARKKTTTTKTAKEKGKDEQQENGNGGGIKDGIQRKRKSIAEAMTQEERTKKTKCGECKKEYTKEKDLTNMIECDMCSNWVCEGCHGIDQIDFGVLDREGIHWVCKGCNNMLLFLISRYKEEGGQILEWENKESAVTWGKEPDTETNGQEEQRKENHELRERIRQLEEKLQEEKDKAKENRENSKGDEKLQNAKAENKRKEQEIKKLKSEVNKRNDEQTRLQLELTEQKTTNTNLNRLLEDVKKVNKRLELEGAPSGDKEGQVKNIDRKKQIPCKYFRRNKCKYGDDCLFKHEREVCKYFERNGWCRFREECRFSHTKQGVTKPERSREGEEKLLRKVEERMTFLEKRLNKLLTQPTKDKHTQQNSANPQGNPTYRPTYAQMMWRQPTMTAYGGEEGEGNQESHWRTHQPNITNAARMNEQMHPNLQPQLMMTNPYQTPYQTPYQIETQIRNDH